MSTQVSDNEVEEIYLKFRKELDRIIASFSNRTFQLGFNQHNLCHEVDYLVSCLFPDSLDLVGHIVKVGIEDNTPIITINKKLIREYLEMTRSSTIIVNVIE